MFAFATACSADVTTIEERTSTPGGSSVTVRSTTEGNPNKSVPLSRTTLIMPMRRRPYYTSTSTVTEYPGLGRPSYMKRVTMLREQLNDGLAKGWITTTDASMFQARLDELAAKAEAADSMRASSLASDSLENQINGLNIDLSRRLDSH